MPFKPGQSGNPLGNGSEGHRLAAQMRKRFAADFRKHGMQAIIDLREKDPGRYLQLGVSLLPKEMQVPVGADFSAALAQASKGLQTGQVTDSEFETLESPDYIEH